MLGFIHATCTTAASKITYKQFELALQAGGLLLVLDGFDEIDYSQRDSISEQILIICRKYPATKIIVSGRPDDRFGSWQEFHIYHVCALEKQQVLELIKKIDYDAGLKKRFLREVDRQLYDTHQSFLSSPLLSSIMLLTYEQFAEIPNKMHIFYEQAFSALFRRHDAQKAQFIRKTYADLALDDFRSFFAAFCAFSYLDERFSFPETTLRNIAKKALEYTEVKCSIDDVLRDLYECVCMLQKDGLDTTFVHRSFQEYFSAVFVATYHGSEVRAVIDRFAKRSRDQVIPMLYEMARTKLDCEWTIPHIDELTSELDDPVDLDSAAKFFNRQILYTVLSVEIKRGAIFVRAVDGALGDNFHIWDLIRNLYYSETKNSKPKRGAFELLVDQIIEEGSTKLLRRNKFDSQSSVNDISECLGLETYKELPKDHYFSPHNPDEVICTIEVKITKRFLEQLRQTKVLIEEIKKLRSTKKVIEARKLHRLHLLTHYLVTSLKSEYQGIDRKIVLGKGDNLNPKI